MRKRSKRWVVGFFARSAIHVWMILFLANFGIYVMFRLFVMAQECMTTDQVQSDSRCLLIYNNDVYVVPGSSGHFGHSCGSDVSGVMNPSHLSNVAHYLTPNRIASICAAAPEPTATPEPTAAPPTNTPRPQPTNTPVPAAPSPTSGSSNPAPTATPQPTAAPTSGASGGSSAPTATPKPKTPTATPKKQGTSSNDTTVGLAVVTPEPTVGEIAANGGEEQQVTTTAPGTQTVTTEYERTTPEKLGTIEAAMLSLQAIFIDKQYLLIGWWIRSLAVLGFAGLGVSMVLGFWRVRLFGLIGRERTMWLHYLAGGSAAVGIVGHILLVYMDKDGWGFGVEWWQLIWPRLGSATRVSMSLGVVGLYLLLLVIGSGVWFKRLSKRLGYRMWHLMHISALIMMMVVFAHGVRIGTDFKNSFVAGGFWVLFLYVLWRLNLAVWHMFHTPKPQGAVAVAGKKGVSKKEREEVKKENNPVATFGAMPVLDKGELVEKTFYVVKKEEDSDKKGWWILLSDGVTRMYGYFAGGAVPRKEWLKVKAAQLYDAHRVPYLAISQLVPV